VRYLNAPGKSGFARVIQPAGVGRRPSKGDFIRHIQSRGAILRMKKLAGFLFCWMTLCAGAAMAQDTAPAAQNQPAGQAPAGAPATPPPAAPAAAGYSPRVPAEIEIAGGYSYRNYSPTANSSYKLNGGFISADYNIFTWLGAAVQAVGDGRRQGTPAAGDQQTLGIATFLAGPQIYPMRHRKLTIETHILIGEGYYGLTAPAAKGNPGKTTTTSGFAYEVGAGLDVRIKRHWSIRLGEGDYGATSFHVGNTHQATYRFAAGVVYLIGRKR